MSYSDKINKARAKATMILVNYDLSVHQLNNLYHEDNCIYLCEDGKCVDVGIEEGFDDAN